MIFYSFSNCKKSQGSIFFTAYVKAFEDLFTVNGCIASTFVVTLDQSKVSKSSNFRKCCFLKYLLESWDVALASPQELLVIHSAAMLQVTLILRFSPPVLFSSGYSELCRGNVFLFGSGSSLLS